MAAIATAGFPTALESGRLGMERAYGLQSAAAQKVAEGGLRELKGDRVTLSDEAQGHRAGRTETASIADGLLDAQVAQYMALASARVVQRAEDTASSVMDILSR